MPSASLGADVERESRISPMPGQSLPWPRGRRAGFQTNGASMRRIWALVGSILPLTLPPQVIDMTLLGTSLHPFVPSASYGQMARSECDCCKWMASASQSATILVLLDKNRIPWAACLHRHLFVCYEYSAALLSQKPLPSRSSRPSSAAQAHWQPPLQVTNH
jgi:hypothetical protein